VLDRERANPGIDSRRPKTAHLLEADRQMSGVTFQQLELLICLGARVSR
jgi:hypothetical protein